ncbi:galactoside alpha-(1,2)-fucosyltransferase 2-like isoform X3 [Ostrea edulis]|uniref:galactoside alpha-(1,2)-fucosyltransferase 2-like isoform X3 n=1 Tax=Ostrea edulis TaxID=37623 RepID=UPI0024AFF33E|nr:galactoside alpha-(1,2)-fucosyltransferase 2-like isoform X3 [Ostrea edulis]
MTSNLTKSKLGCLLFLVTVAFLLVQNIYLRQNQIKIEHTAIQDSPRREITTHLSSTILNERREESENKHRYNLINISTTQIAKPLQTHVRTGRSLPVGCMIFNGRLGNLMFKYAFLHVMSKTKNLYPILPDDFELARYFTLPVYESQEQNSRRAECNTIAQEAAQEAERWSCSYDDKFLKMSSNKKVYFLGYFQSWKYWIKHEDEIRKIFTFNTEIEEEANENLSNILNEMGFRDSSTGVVVGIHSRRGDYLSKPAMDYGYITPNETYYLNAMRYFREKFPTKRIFFIAASNDIDWLRQKLNKEENVFFLQENQPFMDMAILALCDHVIMSSGTFGWWAGWMTKGIVVYYKHIFVPKSYFSHAFRGGDISDFIYPGWVGMT